MTTSDPAHVPAIGHIDDEGQSLCRAKFHAHVLWLVATAKCFAFKYRLPWLSR